MPILDAFRLDGCVALVTGSNRGLGRAAAIALAEAGANVIGVSRENPGDTPEKIAALERHYHHIACDLSHASVERLGEIVSESVAQMGRLDILVNNAGIIRRAPALDHREADWDEVLQVNLKAVFFLSQAGARVMVEQGSGKIINIASLLSYQGGIFVPSYTAAKHGVAGITKALSNEWAHYSINVNGIAPGYMETDNTTPLRSDAERSRAILERIPADRWGRPEDLMGAVVFLASSASQYVHGTMLEVDGGWLGR